MSEEKKDKKKCKRVEYATEFNEFGQPTNTRILKGLIVFDNGEEIDFLTARNRYTIKKKSIISISTTDEDFRENEQNQ